MIDPLAESLHTLQWTLGAVGEEYGQGFVQTLRAALGNPMLPVSPSPLPSSPPLL